jgi:polyphosphate kinase
LGARSGAGGRTGRVRFHGTENAREDVSGGAPRGGKLRNYVHLGTGNYHPITARIYTDLSFFTTDPGIARDVALIFNFITGYAEPAQEMQIALSPFTLKARILQHIAEEIVHAREGRPARIWMKMNSLVDPDIIDGSTMPAAQRRDRTRGARHLLPQAAGAGPLGKHPCQIDRRPFPRAQPNLLLRQRPWPAGGRGDRLHPRTSCRAILTGVECMAPITNPTVHEQVLEQIMLANIMDNQQSFEVLADGTSRRVTLEEGEEPFNAQEYFMTNPSLSGRGDALKSHAKQIAQFKRRKKSATAANDLALPRPVAGPAPGFRYRYRIELDPPRRV